MLRKYGINTSANGKRLVLVVDDEQVNREILGFMLSEEYAIIYAENGREALELVRKNKDTLSLIMTDILMPELNGIELVEILQGDPELARIPIIVLTTEREYEVKSLRLGASDFIKKPYDYPEVILARVRRIIELSENKYIIENTETDELTGLYTSQFFFQYAEQFDRHHQDMDMDAVVIDLEHFHYYNELYGRKKGDALIADLSDHIRSFLGDGSGLACRKDGDNFLIYCRHITDADAFIEGLKKTMSDDANVSGIRLIAGIYPFVDRSVDVHTRFDRAKYACNLVKGDSTRTIAVYDKALHEKNLFLLSLSDEMEAALAEGQFVVYYQPKYNIRGQKPVLASAEALIRWIHPDKGMISPGVFIPQFEQNGMIKKIDRFVWRRAAEQINEWRKKFGVTLPVSVNVSRIDIYDPDLISVLSEIVASNGIEAGDLMLEITESAYTEESKRIIEKVNKLRGLGFKIEMDDFGSGYSSLNMLAELPIDVLKIDMLFARNLLTDEKYKRIFKLMIDIAKHISVPVVAEGVEKKEQLDVLHEMGCDIIQGYYFSAPLPPDKFERLIKENIEQC